MKNCWGCSTLIPDDLIEYIPNGMTYCYPGTVLGDVVFVTGVDSLKRVWPELKELDIAVIVFDARVNLDQWSIPEIELDTRAMRKALTSTNSIRYVNKSPIKRMLKKMQSSFVGNFLTLSYKTRDPDKQRQLRQQVFQAIYKGQRAKYAATINKKSVDLRTLLDSTDCANLESALQEIKTGKSVKLTAKKYKVAVFDLEYVLRAVQ